MPQSLEGRRCSSSRWSSRQPESAPLPLCPCSPPRWRRSGRQVPVDGDVGGRLQRDGLPLRRHRDAGRRGLGEWSEGHHPGRRKCVRGGHRHVFARVRRRSTPSIPARSDAHRRDRSLGRGRRRWRHRPGHRHRADRRSDHRGRHLLKRWKRRSAGLTRADRSAQESRSPRPSARSRASSQAPSSLGVRVARSPRPRMLTRFARSKGFWSRKSTHIRRAISRSISAPQPVTSITETAGSRFLTACATSQPFIGDHAEVGQHDVRAPRLEGGNGLAPARRRPRPGSRRPAGCRRTHRARRPARPRSRGRAAPCATSAAFGEAGALGAISSPRGSSTKIRVPSPSRLSTRIDP